MYMYVYIIDMCSVCMFVKQDKDMGGAISELGGHHLVAREENYKKANHMGEAGSVLLDTQDPQLGKRNLGFPLRVVFVVCGFFSLF